MRLFNFLLLCLAPCLLKAQSLSENSLQLVNSPYDEQNPVLSPDGRTLYFTVSNHPENMGGKRDPGDIWFSSLTGTSWSAPKHAGPLLNNHAYNAVAGVSAKGDQLFLHGHYTLSGESPRTQGISISSRSQNGWSKPANISIPYYQNKSSLLCGAISSDGLAFVFSAETYGTHGVDDIYVAFNVNGKWTEPKNLGIAINTQFQELSPSLSTDKKTLYFSSNGRKGNGSFDIFSSTRLDDSWTKWSRPENLGAAINSSGRELYFRVYGGSPKALYTSTINSDGYGDIQFLLPEISLTDSTIVASVPVPDSTMSVSSALPVPVVAPVRRNEAAAHIYGKILDSKTGAAVVATVSFKEPYGELLIATGSPEGYQIDLPEEAEYTISIEAPGYISSMEKLSTADLQMKEIEMNFNLQPAAVGTKVNLSNVLFAQAKTDILPESFEELDLIVSFLRNNPNVKIELAGHTDNRGVHSDNVKLSQMRVDKVKNYLVSKGIEGKRISGKGYGGTKPVASNETEEQRRMNRRVEFTIRKN